MRNFSRALLFLAVICAFPSCKKLKQNITNALAVNIGMTSSGADFVIPASPAGDTSFMAIDVYLNVDSIVWAETKNFSASNIRTAKITSVTLSLIDGDEQDNFGALESCDVQFSSAKKPDMVTIAHMDNNPDVVAQELNVPVDSDLELKDYFKDAQFSYVVHGRLRRATTKDLHCKAIVKYDVKVGAN